MHLKWGGKTPNNRLCTVYWQPCSCYTHSWTRLSGGTRVTGESTWTLKINKRSIHFVQDKDISWQLVVQRNDKTQVLKKISCICFSREKRLTGLPLGPSSPGGPLGPGGPAAPAGPASPFSPLSPLGPWGNTQYYSYCKPCILLKTSVMKHFTALL